MGEIGIYLDVKLKTGNDCRHANIINNHSNLNSDNFVVNLREKYEIDAAIGIQRSRNISIDPQHYRMPYNKIIGTMVDQIKAQYSSLEEFKFTELLNFSKVDD
ncbi:Hypothetical predicted protein [Octopus vulgaris]|uniref:Uncharacterized protein n=1 Tax=Octopus vulgaris TaxID=6645 RepID=A0AA36AU35_OCTVU|nr:Hypothetical predicted protein [Octopus vulgaris]